MSIRPLFTSILLLFTIYLQGQKLSLPHSGNTISDWEYVIGQVENGNSDTIYIKKFLQPLLDRGNKNDLIIYQVLLANTYAKNYDRINTKSDFYYSQSIIKAARVKNKSLEIWATISYADYLYKFRQITKALPVFLEAIDKIEKLDPKKLLFPGSTFIKIGFYMDTIGDYPQAIINLKKAKQYIKPNSRENASVLDNLGVSYFKQGDLKNAEKNIKEASILSKSIGDEVRYAKTLGNLAQIHERTRNFNTAINLLLEDIKISQKNNSDQNTMYAYTALTRIYLTTNKIKDAKKSVEKANKIAETKSYFKINELDILKLKISILNIEEREDEELAVRRRIEALEDSLNKTDGILPRNQANWMLQKRRYQQNINETNKKLAAESFRKNSIISVGGFLIFLVFLFVIRAEKRAKKKKILIEKKIAEYELVKLKNEQKLSEAKKSLDAQIDFLRQKNVLIQKLHLEIQSLDETQSLPKANDRGKLNDLLKSHLMTEENWINFRLEFEREHANFYKILIKDFPEITDSNLRIILLQKLNFTNAETAGLLGITVEAVKKSKQRLKKKLAEKHNLLFEMITS